MATRKPLTDEQKKLNQEAVKKYQEGLTELKLRFPNSLEINGVDMVTAMRDRAKALGYINDKGVNKGEGSIQSYLIALVKSDLMHTRIEDLS